VLAGRRRYRRFMATGLRITPQVIAVFRLMLADPATSRYGRDIAKETGLQTGTLHPILARLEAIGWVVSYWENPAEHEGQGRPRRRYYRLTGEGISAARAAVAKVPKTNGIRPAQLRPRPGY
jgi:PadR family transcriptional regulator, regulatory protein PadR